MSKKKRSNKKVTRKRGGKVIDSGGYGCVFRPALKCKNTNKRKRHTISKLMTKKHTQSEFEEITRFLPIIRAIPDYEKYFILEDVEVCSPSRLSSSDLENYEKRCTALEKDKITKKNINENLHRLDILNVPDGGVDVDTYLNTIIRSQEIREWSKGMISLLIHGIVPMNKRGLYHGDVKESNILVHADADTYAHLAVRLIDWGLSFQYPSTSHTKMLLLSNGVSYMHIPTSLYRKPLQFNLPFSVILFNETFMKKNREHNYKNNPRRLMEFLNAWMKERGEGHFSTIVRIWSNILSEKTHDKSKEEKEKYVKKMIVKYIITILQLFDSSLDRYFEEVLLKNIDVWGFIMSYYAVIDNRHIQRNDILGNTNTVKQIKRLLFQYLFVYSTRPIPIENVKRDLLQLKF